MLTRSRKRGDYSMCSRCSRALGDGDLSPGRAWCRACENKRRRTLYHRAKEEKQQ